VPSSPLGLIVNSDYARKSRGIKKRNARKRRSTRQQIAADGVCDRLSAFGRPDLADDVADLIYDRIGTNNNSAPISLLPLSGGDQLQYLRRIKAVHDASASPSIAADLLRRGE
jgi:hypothetical protein